MQSNNSSNRIGGVATLTIFCVFLAAMLLALVFGARVYSSISDNATKGYEFRTCSQYIIEKVRHSDSIDSIFVSSFSDPADPEADDISTLYLTSNYDGITYYTRVYCFAGGMRELFTEDGTEINPGIGTLIEAVDDLGFYTYQSESGDDLLTVVATSASGGDYSFTVNLRCPMGSGEVVQ